MAPAHVAPATGSIRAAVPPMRPGPRAAATVAFVHRGLDWTPGGAQCLLDLVGGVDRTRFRPLIICTSPTLAGEAERLDVPVHLSDWWEHGVFAPAPIRARLAQLLREHEVDLVHANMTQKIPSPLPAVRAMRSPIVAHLHMLQTDEYWRLWELVHQTDVAVGVAHHVVEPLLADGMRPDRVRVIHNAVDADRLLAGGDAAGLRASLGIPGEALLAVAIGSLIHRKGHDVTLRGVALARARGADVHLLLCGDGEAADTLRALAAELGVRLAPRGTLGASVRAVGRPGHTSADGLGELVAPGRRPESRPRRRGGPTVISW